MILSNICTIYAADTTVNLEVMVENVANIDFNLDDGINVLYNLQGAAGEEVVLVLRVKTLDGESLSVTKADAVLSAEGEAKLPEVPFYGSYKLEYEVRSKADNTVFASNKLEFAVVNAPKEGITNPKHGINIPYRAIDHNGNYGDSKIYGEIAAKAGFSSARADLTWADFEKEKGKYEIAETQKEIFDSFSENGLDGLDILSYGNKLYMDSMPPESDAEIEAFANYAVELIKQMLPLYEANGQTAEFEIWNEWDNNWNDTWTFNARRLDAADYAKFAKAVYEKIKADPVAKNAKLWGMSALGSNTKYAPGYGEYHKFIKAVLDEWKETDRNLYMDGISFHLYKSGTAYTENPESMLESVSALNGVLSNYGLSGTPLRVTEWGWRASEKTEEGQAAYFVSTAAIADSQNYFEKMDYYNIGDSKNTLDGYGMLRSKSYTPKPVFFAAANYNRITTGATGKGWTKTSGYSYKYINKAEFTLADGQDCVILWTGKDETRTASIDLGESTTAITVCDMYGNETTANSEDGKYVFSIDQRPVYLIGDFSKTVLAEVSNTASLTVNRFNVDSDTYNVWIEGKTNGSNVAVKAVKGESVDFQKDIAVSDGNFKAQFKLPMTLSGVYDIVVDTGASQTFLQKAVLPGEEIESSFDSVMIAAYDSEKQQVTVSGKLNTPLESELVTITVAKQPAEGKKFPDEKDIAYINVLEIKNGSFEISFPLAEGEYGDYVVRIGSANGLAGIQTAFPETQNEKYLSVLTFTANQDESTVTMAASLKNKTNGKSKAILMLAQYGANGVMVDAKAKTVELEKGQSTVEPIVVSQSVLQNAESYKAFIWSGDGNSVPLAVSLGENIEK